MLRWIGFLLTVLLCHGCAIIQLPIGGPDRVQEVTLAGDGEDKVLLVDVSGMLSFRKPRAFPGMPEGESLPARFARDLELARKDPAVKALLVRIDSPGGTVTASDVIWHEIVTLREEKQLPVVAIVVEKALSGGYYVALAADEILAHPTALVGSVGVFVPKWDVSGLLDRWGVRSEITKSGPQKDLLSPARPLEKGDRETLEDIVGELYGRFEAMVRERRPAMTEADLATIQTAAIFAGPRALELHLVDGLGYLRDGFRAAAARAGLERARLVAYRSGTSQPATPYSLASLGVAAGAGPLLLAPEWLEQFLEAGVYY